MEPLHRSPRRREKNSLLAPSRALAIQAFSDLLHHTTTKSPVTMLWSIQFAARGHFSCARQTWNRTWNLCCVLGFFCVCGKVRGAKIGWSSKKRKHWNSLQKLTERFIAWWLFIFLNGFVHSAACSDRFLHSSACSYRLFSLTKRRTVCVWTN